MSDPTRLTKDQFHALWSAWRLGSCTEVDRPKGVIPSLLKRDLLQGSSAHGFFVLTVDGVELLKLWFGGTLP